MATRRFTTPTEHMRLSLRFMLSGGVQENRKEYLTHRVTRTSSQKSQRCLSIQASMCTVIFFVRCRRLREFPILCSRGTQSINHSSLLSSSSLTKNLARILLRFVMSSTFSGDKPPFFNRPASLVFSFRAYSGFPVILASAFK